MSQPADQTKIRVPCSHCGRRLLIPMSRAGTVIRCNCGASLNVRASEGISKHQEGADAIAGAPCIAVMCPYCDRELRVAAKLAGETVKCGCGASVSVPWESDSVTHCEVSLPSTQEPGRFSAWWREWRVGIGIAAGVLAVLSTSIVIAMLVAARSGAGYYRESAEARSEPQAGRADRPIIPKQVGNNEPSATLPQAPKRPAWRALLPPIVMLAIRKDDPTAALAWLHLSGQERVGNAADVLGRAQAQLERFETGRATDEDHERMEVAIRNAARMSGATTREGQAHTVQRALLASVKLADIVAILDALDVPLAKPEPESPSTASAPFVRSNSPRSDQQVLEERESTVAEGIFSARSPASFGTEMVQVDDSKRRASRTRELLAGAGLQYREGTPPQQVYALVSNVSVRTAISFLEDDDHNVRCGAAIALSRAESQEARETLRKASQDKSPSVKSAANWSLTQVARNSRR